MVWGALSVRVAMGFWWGGWRAAGPQAQAETEQASDATSKRCQADAKPCEVY